MQSEMEQRQEITEWLQYIRLCFYENLVVQNGGKESKKLFEYAQSYVMHRFEMLMVEQLAREKVPKIPQVT